MKRKAVSRIMLTLLLIGMLTLAFNIQPVRASGTIYIRADGSVDPPTAPIQQDGDVYTLTDNIASFSDGIVIERDNMTLDGTGHTVQGEHTTTGIALSGRSNVTIKNLRIEKFWHGVHLYSSSNITIEGNNITSTDGVNLWLSSANTILGNTITRGVDGVFLRYSSENTISGNIITNTFTTGLYLYNSSENNMVSGNNIAENYGSGVSLDSSSNNNTVSGNTITGNTYVGLSLWLSSGNTISENTVANHMGGFYGPGDGVSLDWFSNDNNISGNTITNNTGYGLSLRHSFGNTVSANTITENDEYGIWLKESSDNRIDHNSFIDNDVQLYSFTSSNTWDDGYPSGGNYWSDHVTVDDYSGINQDEPGSDGIVDEPYIIDNDNRDNYPLVEPWSPLPRTIGELKTEIEECGLESEIDNQGIVRSLIAKLNVAQKLVDKGKIDEAKSILEDDFIPQVQNLSGIHITTEATDILIQSAEYILSHL